MSSLSELRASPYQLWVVLAMKVFEAVAFFSLMYILAKFLSDDLGFSDVEAGWLFAFCNGMQFPFALGLSFVLDSVGVARMCFIGECCLITARLLLWLAPSRGLVYVVLLVLYPMGTAALLPALIVGIKRFSTPLSRPYAFAIFYTMMNVASLSVAMTLNYLRHHSDHSQIFTQILRLGCITSACGLLSSFFLREQPAEATTNPESQASSAPEESKFQIALQTFQTSIFWKFMAVVGSFVMIRAIFGHLSATVPKWMTREFGEDTPYELFVGINPALIIVLVPICTRVCEMLQIKVESALIIGAMISGFSPFLLVFSFPNTVVVACFIIVFSIGEAIWSPKLLEYTVSVPQEGREGVFVACASAPLYLSKFMAGATSGYLLKYYCPRPDDDADKGCSSRALWAAIAATTCVTPIVLLVFRQQLFTKKQDDISEDTALLKKAIN